MSGGMIREGVNVETNERLEPPQRMNGQRNGFVYSII